MAHHGALSAVPVIVMVSVTVEPGLRARAGLLQWLNAPTEKSPSEASKKRLPEPCTLMRALADAAATGKVTLREPSLGVAVARTIGKVVPPSLDRRMSTLAALTGAPFVPATFQVTVWALLTG